MIMSITIGGHDGTAAPATPAAGLRQAWMPQEQGTPSDVGTADVTSVPELGSGERLAALAAEASPAVALMEPSPAVALIGPSPAAAHTGPGPAAPVETTLTTPSVEAAPGPPSTARQPGTRAVGTRPDPVAWLIALATFAAYTTLSVARYLRLNPGSWDPG